ncbi:MAG: hypothetical protein R2750_11920 [Bacteroidales bacterium]
MKKIFYLSIILIFPFSLFISKTYAQLPENFGALIYSVDLGSQTPTPDRTLMGIQYANGHIWATGYDPDDYWQHKLYKFNADATALLETYSYGIEAAGWNDMAWDGEFLYVADMQVIREIDPITGEKTGVTFPAPFYYNRGLAYNPLNDHFYVSGEGGFNIYEIDRTGEVIGAIPGTSGNYYVGLAVDTLSPGAPFLWAYTNEEQGYNLVLKAKQISLTTNLFTGVEFEGASISNIINETAGGATISYDYASDSVTFVAINIRNGNANDQMEYAMFYDITRNEIPGAQISVDPVSIQNVLPPGDSVDILVNVANNGDAPLFWSAYLETPDQDTTNNLGEMLFSFNGTEQTNNNDRGLNTITFLNGIIWVNGRNFGGPQPTIYKFSPDGELISSHPYNTISNLGFRTLSNDGEFLYGEDTYSIHQIDPETFVTVGYIIKPSGSFSGVTYDPQTDHFWGGNGNGLIYEFDRDGEVVNEFITPFDIQGLAWDTWSPNGPFLWAWIETNSLNGSKCEAIRLNPNTCTIAGEGFIGNNFSNDTFFQDLPKGAVITNQWQENKVTLLGIHSAGFITPSDTTEGVDFIAVYDLDVVPPPGWISLMSLMEQLNLIA